MRESIYSIPITDVFKEKEGCAFCRLYKMLEERCIEYISGAAMMEPDIRIETNRMGFCGRHLNMLLSVQKKLSAALILETHINELAEGLCTPPQKGKAEHCFVCHEIGEAIEKMAGNAMALFAKESDVRDMMQNREYYCREHFDMLKAAAYSELPKKQAAASIGALAEVQAKYCKDLYSDLHDFSLMFDYRNQNKEKTEGMLTAFERAKKLLAGDMQAE